MRDSIYRITLDVHDIASQIQLTAKLSDNARRIHIQLTENGKPYLIEPGCRAVMMIRKPDNNILLNDCDIRLTDSTIIYEFTSQTVSAQGIAECEVRVYGQENDLLTSPRFTLLVSGTVYDDGQIESESEFTTLTQAIFEANNLNIEVETDGDNNVITVTHKDGSTNSVNVYDWEDTIEEMQGYVASAEASATAAETSASASSTSASASSTSATASETSASASGTSALVSEGFAKGTQNGVPVTEGSPYYQNNSEYFKDQAEGIVGGDNFVKYTSQTKTDAEKETARLNIGAISSASVTSMISELKDAPLFEGNINGAPLGLCRMNAGAVSWTSSDVTVVTIASEDKKIQLALGNGSYSAAKMRVYIYDAWAEWQALPTYVVDDLNSNSPSGALSAKQGKVLKELVDTKLSTSGGYMNGSLHVHSNSTAPVTVKNTSSGHSTVAFDNSSGNLGVIGFRQTGVPYIYLANVSSTYDIHHDGNSSRVAIQSSQPSTDNTLWVK